MSNMENIIEIDGKKYLQTIKPVSEEKEKVEVDKKLSKIVLEIGHNAGPDVGAIDPRSGATEHSLNVITANEAKKVLEKIGYANVVVTDSKESLWNIGFKESRDANVFVSIHHNAYSSESAQGSECLYSPKGNEDDIRLASIISAKCSKHLGIRNRGAKKMGLSILSGATYDRFKDLEGAVLAEGYFITGKMIVGTHKEWSIRYGHALAYAIDDFLSE